MSDAMIEIVLQPPPVNFSVRREAGARCADFVVEVMGEKLRTTVHVPNDFIHKVLSSSVFTDLATKACARLAAAHLEAHGAVRASGIVGALSPYALDSGPAAYTNPQLSWWQSAVNAYSLGDEFGFSFSLPNPAEMISSVAHGIAAKAESAAQHLVSHVVPAHLKHQVATAMTALQNAPSITQAEALSQHIGQLIGSHTLPGGIPLSALSPNGAVAAAAAHMFG